MTHGWWDKVSAAVERVIDAPVEARASVLASLVGDDSSLRAEVEELVAAYRTGGDRFDQPAVDRLMPARPSAPIVPGERIGPYQIVREIGHGGMGSVYEATRTDDDFRKRVALKTVTGAAHPDLLRRFRQERRILARLDHRHIAALLDGGILPNGIPYFAMEYVEGEPIDRYCVDKSLTVADRLQLLRQVAGAVQFAHQSLVVHRDLKPSNVLVTADGTVKLLDFGIAKVLDPDDDASDPELTKPGTGPFTPAYASPEQLRGDPVTTASDIHAMGVLMFQVLTGRHPHRTGDPAPAELRRRILEQQPPTTGLGTDLDAIIGKAMHLLPERRYASAEQLGDDLLLWQAGRPVRARPDTFGYRARAFVRRNAWATAAVAVAVASLIATAIVSVRQARVAAAERDRARLEAAKANRIASFVQDILRAADPRESGPDRTVAQALGAAALRADSALSADPPVLAAVLTAIGRSYLGLGRYEEAEPPLRRALALRQATDSASVEVAQSLSQLGSLLSDRGAVAPAESLFESALTRFRAQPAVDTAAVAGLLNSLGDLRQYTGDLDRAEAAHREALGLWRASQGDRGEGVAASLNNLAVIEGQRGRWVAAESLSRAALGIAVERLGPRHPDVAAGLNALAFAVEELGRVAEAESLYREVLSLRRDVLGDDHPETARTKANLGWLLEEAGRHGEARALAGEVLALRGRVLGDDHATVATALVLLGEAELSLGSPTAAEAALRDALRLRRAALPARHWLIGAAQSSLAAALTAQRRWGEARELLTEAVAALEAGRGVDHPLTVRARERQAALVPGERR